MWWAVNCSITESLPELIQQVRQNLAGAPGGNKRTIQAGALKIRFLSSQGAFMGSNVCGKSVFVLYQLHSDVSTKLGITPYNCVIVTAQPQPQPQ